MIEVKSLYKSFEDKEVLKDINSVFENGKTNLIIGQSGSGKTVLMKCIVGLFRPTSGEVLYDGRDLVTMNKQEWKMLRREMGMIFQSAALFDSMTVLENVMFPLDMFSKDSYAERVKRAQFCLDRVNLLEAQKKFPDEISGGMQKRVAIARAIALNPKYLFCELGSRPQNLTGDRRADSRHHRGIQHDHYHQHARHEFRNGHRRKHPIYI